MSDVVTARHLSKRYGSVEAVVDVSFSVAEGEVLCLLGPNGAGKSTTIRICSTLARADGGSAVVAGHDVRTQPQRVRASIGYVAQHAGTDAYLTGFENLLVQAASQRLRRSVAIPRARELLDVVGLVDAGHRLVRTYSGGMRRRLEIAMGIVHDPHVLFLDEPTTGLDPEARTALWDELTGLANRQSLSILLTTHYLDEADRLADRIVIINKGLVIAEGTPESLKAELLGDTVCVEFSGRPSAEAVLATTGRLDARDTTFDGVLFRARVAHGNRALPAILSGFDAAGFRIESASVTCPTLDDVYRHHTGHKFAGHEDSEQVELATG